MTHPDPHTLMAQTKIDDLQRQAANARLASEARAAKRAAADADGSPPAGRARRGIDHRTVLTHDAR